MSQNLNAIPVWNCILRILDMRAKGEKYGRKESLGSRT